MKIENIGQIKEVEQIQIISEYTVPKFAEGQILIAQVEHIEGDKVTLKNNEGRFFMALMQDDLGLSEGNIVEVAANSNGSGYVLHLLNVSANMQNGKLALDKYMISGTLATMKANPGLDPKAASFLIENNIPRTPENIAALAGIIHGGSGLGELLAGILSGLEQAEPSAQAAVTAEIPVDTQNTPLMQNGAKPGNTAGKTTAQTDAQQISYAPGQENIPTGQATADNTAGQASAPGILIQTENIQQNAAAQQAGTAADSEIMTGAAQTQNPAGSEIMTGSAQTQSSAEAAAVLQGQPASEAPTAAQGLPSMEAAPSQAQDTAAMVNTAATPSAVDTAIVSEGKVSQAAPQVILNEDIYVMKENTAADGKAAAAASQAETETIAWNMVNTAAKDMPAGRLLNKEEITDTITAMFCRPDKQTGAEFKKTILDIPDGLNTLKLLLHQSDKQDRSELIQKAGQAQKQFELLAESKRFDCIQIPFMLKNGAEKTAELYVYRHKRSQKEQGEEGLTVLIALDTQHIGRVETLMKAAGKSLSLEFRLEHKDIQPEIIKRSKALAKSLENAGYTLKSLKITGLETKTTVLNAGGVLIPDAGVSPGNIDVQI